MQQNKDTKDFIKEKLYESGKSLNGFAFDAGIEPAILSRIINKKQGIKLDVLIKIAKELNIKLSEFFKELEDKNYNY